ncbi:MAG: hypothetical protein GEV11_11695, partial [Streptosporangiales bacterium]|nr:hypothetical protein [Streptosporangiales bacterium]
ALQGAAEVLARGRRVSGTRCVPGGAYGPLRYVRPHEPAPPGGGHILLADRPRPALAPLLFGAAGLVCTSGPNASHLGEVARSLGVPMLVGAPVDTVTGPPAHLGDSGGWLAAIDATTGELALLPNTPKEAATASPATASPATASPATATPATATPATPATDATAATATPAATVTVTGASVTGAAVGRCSGARGG